MSRNYQKGKIDYRKKLERYSKFFRVLIAISALSLVLIAVLVIRLNTMPIDGTEVNAYVFDTGHYQKQIYNDIYVRRLIVTVIEDNYFYNLKGVKEKDASSYEKAKKDRTEITVYKCNDNIYVDKDAARDDTALSTIIDYTTKAMLIADAVLICAFFPYHSLRKHYRLQIEMEDYEKLDQLSSSLEDLNDELENEINSIESDTSPFKPYTAPEPAIRDIKFTINGSWTQCEALIEGTIYDWDTILNSADYMIGKDLSSVLQVTIQSRGTQETNCLTEYKQNNSIKATPSLKDEQGLLSIAGRSKKLAHPTKIVWLNRKNTLRIFTTSPDNDAIRRYIEDMINRKF